MSDLRKAAELAMLDIERNAHLLGVTHAEQRILGNTPLRTTTAAECYYRLGARKEELRTALAAPEPEPEPVRHPGYVIGNHWLETAYQRLCAGEAEDAILEDYDLVRITDGTVETADIHAIVDRQEALRRDAERYRWLQDAGQKRWMELTDMTAEATEAAIDAAMKGDKT